MSAKSARCYSGAGCLFCNVGPSNHRQRQKPALLFVDESIVDQSIVDQSIVEQSTVEQSIVDHSTGSFSHFGQFKSGFSFQNNGGVVMNRFSKFNHEG